MRRGDEVEEGGKMKGGGEDNEYIQIALLLLVYNSPLGARTNTDIRVNISSSPYMALPDTCDHW